MGAVFALFAAWYLWGVKILGHPYNELLAQIHFWALTIGVNLTFGPMHALGMAGQPRRIPDYPDAYIGWNSVESYGSIVSLVATILFLYILFDQLTTKAIVSPNPWAIPSFFESVDLCAQPVGLPHTNRSDVRRHVPTSPTLSAPTIEWLLSSPPAFHTFNELPITSGDSSSSLSSQNSPPLGEPPWRSTMVERCGPAGGLARR
jgi:cytochrome c oxidase subunit 1